MDESAEPWHRSSLADHPDVQGVLPIFVGRLAGHVRRLRELRGAGDAEGLRRLAHQLRGTGQSFGFAPVSAHAAVVEEMLLAGRGVEEITPALQELIGYIEHIEGYG
jgi:HPt (histidine-containing phosphotransfer) domain-containing protein